MAGVSLLLIPDPGEDPCGSQPSAMGGYSGPMRMGEALLPQISPHLEHSTSVLKLARGNSAALVEPVPGHQVIGRDPGSLGALPEPAVCLGSSLPPSLLKCLCPTLLASLRKPPRTSQET